MMDLVFTVPAAIGLGALHALEPGHGKGVITAYLVATRGQTKDALLLGAISAVTHTFSIVVLSLTASTAIHRLAPELLTHWIELFSGIVITLIGAKILYNYYFPRILAVGKLSQLRGVDFADVDRHGHGHDHGHWHGHRHDHGGHRHHRHGDSDQTPRSLLRLTAVGFLTGIIPCPSAIAIFLAAITAEQIPFGIGLVGAFSLGSAITMSTIGLLVVRVGSSVVNRGKIGFLRSLNQASSVLIIGIGLLVIMQSVGRLYA